MEKITRKTVERMSRQLYDVMEKRRKNIRPIENTSKSYDLLLNDSMLRKKKYDISTLEKNINNLSMKTLLYTQNLTAEFCVKYILNDEYASCIEDTYICIGDVLNAQKHLTVSDIATVYRCNY
jgi:hypothetical protein